MWTQGPGSLYMLLAFRLPGFLVVRRAHGLVPSPSFCRARKQGPWMNFMSGSDVNS